MSHHGHEDGDCCRDQKPKKGGAMGFDEQPDPLSDALEAYEKLKAKLSAANERIEKLERLNRDLRSDMNKNFNGSLVSSLRKDLEEANKYLKPMTKARDDWQKSAQGELDRANKLGATLAMLRERIGAINIWSLMCETYTAHDFRLQGKNCITVGLTEGGAGCAPCQLGYAIQGLPLESTVDAWMKVRLLRAEAHGMGKAAEAIEIESEHCCEDCPCGGWIDDLKGRAAALIKEADVLEGKG